MPAWLITLIAACVLYLLDWWNTPGRISPDGRFYAAVTEGQKVPRPYCWRWLIPSLAGKSWWRWKVINAASLVAAPVVLCFYLQALGFVQPWQQLAGAGFLVGLHGLWRFNVGLPVLVDPPAFALAMASAWAALEGHFILAMALGLVAGAAKESAPVFAAAFSLSPWPLVGLLGVGWWRRAGPVPDWAKDWLERPFWAAKEAHTGLLFKPEVMLLPWGVLVLLVPFAVGWDQATFMAALAAVLGYGQMLRSMDRARLFCWAAPPVIALVLAAVPESMAAFFVAAHLFNPYRGT